MGLLKKTPKMVRVKLNSGMVGHRPCKTTSGHEYFVGFAYNAGDIIELPAAEAERYLQRGFASAVEDQAVQLTPSRSNQMARADTDDESCVAGTFVSKQMP